MIMCLCAAATEPQRLERSGPLPAPTPGAVATPGTRMALGATGGAGPLLDALTCLAVRAVRGHHSRFFGQSTPAEEPVLLPSVRHALDTSGQHLIAHNLASVAVSCSLVRC